ncbi:MAG: hypothetical protein IKR19_07700 [Acholeplasmatales bacterium]|nr:hypothetical protein [Acholeplasmatales bacterium]
MTIDEALETIKGERWIACSEKYKEAMNLITDTIHKYQEIKEIVNHRESYLRGEIIGFGTKHYMRMIEEVIEDGK